MINCTISGHRRYLRDLSQGGLEVPCRLRFTGTPNEAKKVKLYFDQKTSSSNITEITPPKVLIPLDIKEIYSSETKVVMTLTSMKVPVTHDIAEVSVIPECDTNSNSSKDCVELLESKEDTRSTIQLMDINSCSNVWIVKEGKTLNLTDKALLEQGQELTDKYINMAQHLLKVQFPLIGGLQSTLLQQKLPNTSKGSCTANTIQAIHCKKRMHWITAMTKFCDPGMVNIYDTLYSALDAETRTIVKQLFGLKATTQINIVPIQLQKGSKDCGGVYDCHYDLVSIWQKSQCYDLRSEKPEKSSC